MRALKHWPVLPLAGLLTACPPPIYPEHRGDYDLDFAKAYFRALDGREATDCDRLTIDQHYALYRFSRERLHHGPRLCDLSGRAEEAARFLRARLEAADDRRAVDAILAWLRGDQRRGVHDVRSDPAYVALIQRKAAEHDDRYGRLRDLADDIATDSELPSILGGWLEPLFGGLDDDDFDEAFAEGYCRGCDYRETAAGFDRLTVEQLYAVQRHNWDRRWPRNFNRYMARRGAEAAALFKQKLGGDTSAEMVWVILSTLELMRDLGTYDVAGDAELMALARRAVEARSGWREAETEAIFERIRTGAHHPYLAADER